MTAKSANGIKGQLIRSFDGTYYFRVYDKDHNFEEKTIISINIPPEENIEIPYNLMEKNEIHNDLTVYKSDNNNFIVKINNNNLSIEIRKKFFYKNKNFIDLLNLEYDLYN